MNTTHISGVCADRRSRSRCRPPGYGVARLLGLALALPLGSAAEGTERWDQRFVLPVLNGAVAAMTAAGDDLYVGGAFTLAGAVAADQGITVNHVFRWRDGSLTTLGAGLNGAVNAIALQGGEVYVGGAFTRAGGAEANHLAKWDGQGWSPLGGGVNGTVHALAVRDGEVYVGGQFTTAGGLPVNGIARWNGSEWSAVGGGLGAGGTVRALAFWEGELYAGGFFITFQTINGLPGVITHLARWNGESWSALGSGVNNQVHTLWSTGPHLYVGGTFTTAGGGTVNKLARWDGASWSALGAGFSTGILDAVNALAVLDGQLVAGGVTSRPRTGRPPTAWPAGTAPPGTRWVTAWSVPLGAC